MSWHCSRALVAEFSEGICSAGDASAQSNTTPTPEAYYWPDKTTEHSRLSRFGMMSEPLTVDRGEELLMSYLAAFPVRTSVAQEKALESTESAVDYGQKWRGSLAKYDPDTHSLRTAQCSLIEDLTGCSVTLPDWGSMRNGELFLRPVPAHFICESVSGLWPTPTANEDAAGRPGAKMQLMLGNHPDIRGDCTGGTLNPYWVEWLMGWPIGWTDLKPLVMANSQFVQQQHSLNYQDKAAA